MRAALRTGRVMLAWVVVSCLAASAGAAVKLPGFFTDHMMFQREAPVTIWGWADPGETVKATLGDQSGSARADKDGRWSVPLPAMAATDKPMQLTVAGSSTITLKDILVGDLWLCGGQSNMEWQMGGCNAPEDIRAANFPAIRCVRIAHRASATPMDDVAVEAPWRVAKPETVGGMTAVGFYFARTLQRETGVPIGLLDSNWGGTAIEPWLCPEGMADTAELSGLRNDFDKRLQDYRRQVGSYLDEIEKRIPDFRKALADNRPLPPAMSWPRHPSYTPGEGFGPQSLYNAMIHPLLGLRIKGALWYQGESNGHEGESYFHKKKALIGGWRKVWNSGEFPFYFVQLANFQGPNNNPEGGDGWARVRMAQLQTLTIPHTGMAVIIDIGEAGDIHPRNKADVGDRLARWALAKDYGKKDLVCSGPLYKEMKVEGKAIRVSFECAGSGLMVGKKDGRKPTAEDAGGKLKRFAIAGADRKWYWADAVIDGNTVVVSSPDVPAPVAVRYAYSMNPEGCNLYNKEGLPASPFRTDNW